MKGDAAANDVDKRFERTVYGSEKRDRDVTAEMSDAAFCDASIAISTETADNLLRRDSEVKLVRMKRQLIAVIVILAITLQGSLVAYAGISPLMSSDCQTAAVSNSAISPDACCPKGHHTMSCCLEACMGAVAGAIPATLQVRNWVGFATLVPQFLSTQFSSRGDSPLIRPPIL